MSSSTFSSRTARSAALVWIFAATFGALVTAGLVIDQRLWWRMGTPFQTGIAPPWPGSAVTQLVNVLDYDAYLYDHAGTAQHMRAADVLFLGNSRGLYAFRPEGYQPHLDRYGLRGYTLAFLGGSDGFALELIRRYDLRPKLVIVNGDAFFDDTWGRLGAAARDRGRWNSWKFYYESVAAWEAARRLHRWVPPWRRYYHERDHHVVYRSVETGGIYFPYAIPAPRDLMTRRPDTFTQGERELSEKMFPAQLDVLRTFAAEVTRRGGAMIMTFAPYPELNNVLLTRRLSEATGIPFVEVWPTPLVSYNGSHMGGESAVVFMDALFEALRREPVFRKVAGDPR